MNQFHSITENLIKLTAENKKLIDHMTTDIERNRNRITNLDEKTNSIQEVVNDIQGKISEFPLIKQTLKVIYLY